MTSAGITGLMPQVRADLNGKPYRPAGGVFAVEGTVYPGAPNPPLPITDGDGGEGWWAGFASGAIGGLINVADGLWYVETIGYPAVTTPMWPSVQIGRHNLGFSIKVFADQYKAKFGVYPPICMIGWSQGSMVCDQVWTEDILPDNGYLNYLKDYVYRLYEYGAPLRTPGISLGDELAGLPGPGKQNGVTTGGIGGPQDLTKEQTLVKAPDGQNVVISFNNHGDLYGAAPVGDNPWKSLPSAGQTEYNFFKVIMQPGFADIVETGLGFFNVVGDVEGGYNAAKFFAAGPNAPHFQYWDAMNWVINDLVALGNKLPHSLGV